MKLRPVAATMLVAGLLMAGAGSVLADHVDQEARNLLREIIRCAEQGQRDGFLKGYERANITRAARHSLRDLGAYERRMHQGREAAARQRLESYYRNLDAIDAALDAILERQPGREELVAKIRALLEDVRKHSPPLDPTPSPSPSPTPPSNCAATVSAQPIVEDDFNSYANGSIVGQGGWENYVNANHFIVQGAVTNEGTKALHISNASVDNVVTKLGTQRADGKQAVCVRTENRSNWDFYLDGNAQFRVTKNSWAGGTDVFAAVTFKPDGHVAYFDVGSGQYQNFATYNDSEWTLLEIEWRSSDRTARYRVNSAIWTDWKTFKGASSFTGFDYVGFDFTRGGSGGVYFDTLK